MNQKEKEILAEQILFLSKAKEVWWPFPGPQTQAFFSEADCLFYGGAAGGGKLLDINTLIPSVCGWIRMGDIKVGDIIFDEKGKQCNVICVEPITTDKTFLLKFSDGSEIVAGSSHKWVTETIADREALFKRTDEYRLKRRLKREKRGTGKRLDVVLRNSEKKYDYKPVIPSIKTTEEIVNTLFIKKRVNHSIRVCDPIELPERDLLIDPYVLGAWLGDGTSKAGSITGIDDGIFDEIRNAGFVVTDHADIKNKGILGLQKLLKELGVYGNKHIPKEYLRASIDQRLSLLQGLMDTDGYCDKRGQCEFTNINKRLIDEVEELICSLGIKVVVCEGIAMLNGVSHGKKYRLKFLSSLPVFRLKRKLDRQKLENFRGTHNRRYIVSATEIDEVPMRCIAVDSESHLYLAGKTFIPTHNTDLMLGVAYHNHDNSIIFRKEYPQLKGIIDRSKTILRNIGKYNSTEKVWKLYNDKKIEFGAVGVNGDEEKYQGRAHDLKGFDEITHFSEYQFKFLIAWCRTTVIGQRTRIICAGNPPQSSEGFWVKKYWAPWLDSKHKNPANPGELRWFTTINDEEIELESGESFTHKNELIVPKSRTFIPARVEDNPILIEQGYKSTLQSLDEPFRSQMLYGDFNAGISDAVMQVIPTDWVLKAQARWRERKKPELEMTTLGVDVARGGKDKTVLSPRYGNWFDKQIVFKGSDTPDGKYIAGLVIQHARQDTQINIDICAIGASPYDFLIEYFKNVNGLQSAGSAGKLRDRSGLFTFINLRAAWWWQLREDLDPDPAKGKELAIPDDTELLADLTSPVFQVTPRGIKIESKDDIIKRLNRSPDKGDSLVYANIATRELFFGTI